MDRGAEMIPQNNYFFIRKNKIVIFFLCISALIRGSQRVKKKKKKKQSHSKFGSVLPFLILLPFDKRFNWNYIESVSKERAHLLGPW